MRRNSLSAKLSSILLIIPLFFSTNLATVSADSFKDVKAGSDYFVAISYLKDQKIINGYEDNTFQASRPINRAEALKMLTLASGLFSENMPKVKKAPFSDTPLDEWYTPYISAAKEKKIVTGFDDGSFKPNDTISLAEALKMYLESIKSVQGKLDLASTQDTAFIDVAPDNWAAPYTSYAGANNLINIYSDNTVNPDQKMTRGYLAEIIYRTLKSKEGLSFGKCTYYGGLATKDGDSYDKDMMTTAHLTLPFGTIVEVTNLENGKSVKVKVTDRGPYGPGRVLDLSKKAFSLLASPSEGVITVQYKVSI